MIQTAETVEAIVTQLMEKQRAARTASLNKQLECGCPDSTASDKPCIHQQQAIAASAAAGGGGTGGGGGRKVQATKSEAHTTSGGDRPARAPSSPGLSVTMKQFPMIALRHSNGVLLDKGLGNVVGIESIVPQCVPG